MENKSHPPPNDLVGIGFDGSSPSDGIQPHAMATSCRRPDDDQVRRGGDGSSPGEAGSELWGQAVPAPVQAGRQTGA